MDDTAVRFAEAAGLIVVGFAVGGVAVLLVVGLLKAGKLPPSVALVISLSILTLVAMVGFKRVSNLNTA